MPVEVLRPNAFVSRQQLLIPDWHMLLPHRDVDFFLGRGRVPLPLLPPLLDPREGDLLELPFGAFGVRLRRLQRFLVGVQLQLVQFPEQHPLVLFLHLGLFLALPAVDLGFQFLIFEDALGRSGKKPLAFGFIGFVLDFIDLLLQSLQDHRMVFLQTEQRGFVLHLDFEGPDFFDELLLDFRFWIL